MQTQENQAPKKWTILQYCATDNNLRDSAVENLNELESSPDNDNIDIISLVDRNENDCKIYKVKHDDDKGKINSSIIKDMGNTNTADPKTLTNFLIEMMQKYPAEHYAVILEDHGFGWNGVLYDQSSNEKTMTVPQLRQAFEEAQKATGIKIDIIAFDACSMASGEVASELKNAANYMIASQEVLQKRGFNYENLFVDDPQGKPVLDLTPEEMGKRLLDKFIDRESVFTFSLFNLNKMDKYLESSKKLANALLETDTKKRTLVKIAGETKRFTRSINTKDQYHFCQKIANDPQVTDQALKDAAKELMNVIENEVILKNFISDNPNTPWLKADANCHGISTEISGYNGPILENEYEDLIFDKETQWKKSINKFTKK
jgi:hypothetical protein